MSTTWSILKTKRKRRRTCYCEDGQYKRRGVWWWNGYWSREGWRRWNKTRRLDEEMEIMEKRRRWREGWCKHWIRSRLSPLRLFKMSQMNGIFFWPNVIWCLSKKKKLKGGNFVNHFSLSFASTLLSSLCFGWLCFISIAYLICSGLDKKDSLTHVSLSLISRLYLHIEEDDWPGNLKKRIFLLLCFFVNQDVYEDKHWEESLKRNSE